jgi:DNA-directed RNA polymerase specialized sigma24 family protein
MADGAAFATLVPGQIAAVVRTAAALVGKADAEDAAQEAIMRAWQAWPSLQDVEALRPWLLRITTSACSGDADVLANASS